MAESKQSTNEKINGITNADETITRGAEVDETPEYTAQPLTAEESFKQLQKACAANLEGMQKLADQVAYRIKHPIPTREKQLSDFAQAIACCVDEQQAEEAQQHAAAMEKFIAISDAMDEGRFDEESSTFIPLQEDSIKFEAGLFGMMKYALVSWTKFKKSELAKQLHELFPDFYTWIDETAMQRSFSDMVFFGEISDELTPLIPYLIQETNELKKLIGSDQLKFADFICKFDDQGNRIESYFEKALLKARQRKDTEEAATKMLQILPRLQSIAPQHHTIPNNALANSLQHGAIGSGENARTGDLTVGHKGKQEITTLVSVNYTPENGVTIKSTNYTEFDRQVQNAVVSLWLYGDESHIITPAIVARAMTGKNDSRTPSAAIVEAITKSIEKQWQIFVEVDATEEITSYLTSKGTPPATGSVYKWRAHLLELKAIDVINGKKKIAAYQVIGEPILLQYAELTGQLLTVKASLLDIKEIDKLTDKASTVSMANTDSRISIKGYLLRRVEIIKHDHKSAAEALRKYNDRRKNNAELPAKQLADFTKQQPIILFESVFTETGINTTDRKQIMLFRNYAFAVLAYWKAEGYIDGYHLHKKAGKGNPVTGIIIDFDE